MPFHCADLHRYGDLHHHADLHHRANRLGRRAEFAKHWTARAKAKRMEQATRLSREWRYLLQEHPRKR